jgi:hypothetical protein
MLREPGIVPPSTGGSAARMEVVNSGAGTASISGQDYLTALNIPLTGDGANLPGNLLFSYRVNPAQMATASLNQYASLYTEFKFNSISLLFATSESFAWSGSLIAVYIPDGGATVPLGAVALRTAGTAPGSFETPIIRSAEWHFKVSLPNEPWKYCKLNTSTKEGLQNTTQGTIALYQVVPVGVPSGTPSTATPGSLYLKYNCTFAGRVFDVLDTPDPTPNTSANFMIPCGKVDFPFGDTDSGVFYQDAPWKTLSGDLPITVVNNSTPVYAFSDAKLTFSIVVPGSYAISISSYWESAGLQAPKDIDTEMGIFTTTNGNAVILKLADNDDAVSFSNFHELSSTATVTVGTNNASWFALYDCSKASTGTPATFTYHIAVTGVGAVFATQKTLYHNALWVSASRIDTSGPLGSLKFSPCKNITSSHTAKHPLSTEMKRLDGPTPPVAPPPRLLTQPFDNYIVVAEPTNRAPPLSGRRP